MDERVRLSTTKKERRKDRKRMDVRSAERREGGGLLVAGSSVEA